MKELGRLPLTPFERLQYWEVRPGHPNQIVAVLDFQGRFNPSLFQEAVARVLVRHPLLFSRLQCHGQRPQAFIWPGLSNVGTDEALTTAMVAQYLTLQRMPEDWEPSTLPSLASVQPDTGPAFRLTIQFNDTCCRWIMQTHHVVCDGVGGLQAIREGLQVYHWLSSSRESAFPLRPLDPNKLRQRGQAWRFEWSSLWKLPMKWIGLFGASKFLLRRPVSLQPDSCQTPSPSGTDASETPIAWVEGHLSASQTQQLRQAARQFGVTVNSLLLAQWLASLHRFRRQQASAGDSDCYRLMVPTNERRGSDISLPACNRVSMVYVDRSGREMEHLDGLAKGIDFEMGVIRRWELSKTFLVALSMFSWIPGLLRWYSRRPSCWATSYVTNLGPIMDRLYVGTTSGGEAQVGELTLRKVRLLPPLRPQMPAALAVCYYAGELKLTLHYQATEFPQQSAQQLLQSFVTRLKTM